MSKSKCKSIKIISQSRLRKIEMLIADRWLETWEIVETRNSKEKYLRQRYDFWIEQISL